MSGRLTQCDPQRLILALWKCHISVFFFWEAALRHVRICLISMPSCQAPRQPPGSDHLSETLPISSLPVQNFYECLDSSAPPDSLSLRDPSGLWYLASQMSYRQSLRPGLLASPAGLFHCHCWPAHENERLHLQSPRCVSQIFLSTKATRHAVKLHIHPTAIQIPSIPQIRFFVPILFLNRSHNFCISMYLLQSLKHLN